MRSSLFALVALVTATATASASLSSPEAAAQLLRRQAPGTPQYDCHSDCGGVISIGRTENYCDNSTFTEDLAACLECALEYNIWQYYGESVTTAAERCGLDATPLAATNGTSTNGTASATSTPAPTGSTTSGDNDASTTTSASSSSGTNESATTATSGSADTASGTASVAVSTNTGAANQLVISGALAMLPIGAIVMGGL